MKYILKKKNRVIVVENEKLKESYKKDGYDYYDEKGKLVEPATAGKTYTALQYNKLLEEIKKLKKRKYTKKVEEPKPVE